MKKYNENQSLIIFLVVVIFGFGLLKGLLLLLEYFDLIPLSI